MLSYFDRKRKERVPANQVPMTVYQSSLKSPESGGVGDRVGFFFSAIFQKKRKIIFYKAESKKKKKSGIPPKNRRLTSL